MCWNKADSGLGYPEPRPYDRIAVTAACTDIPPELLEQLANGGRLIAPVIGTDGQDLVVWKSPRQVFPERLSARC